MSEELSTEVSFLRNGGAGGRTEAAGAVAGLAFRDPERVATIMRSMSQDSAGVPRLPGTEAGEPSLEIVVERANFLPACFLEVGALRSGAVCQVKASGINYEGARGQWSGTGFLVSDSILLTNHHVLNSPEVAKDSRCIFNYQVDEDGMDQPTKGYRVNPSRLFVTSRVGELDLTFVWVEGEPGKEFGFVPLTRSSFTIFNDEYANIIQHPSGRPKSVVVQESVVKWQDPLVVHYTSDTEPGSSGSCVFNNEWRPVALHHASRKAAAGSASTHLNEGIKLAAVAAHLEKLAENANSMAREVLALFHGVDSMMGFFGSLGRTAPDQRPGVETVVDSYAGEAADIDVGFWNVEWLARRYEDKVEVVADVIVRLNLDIWALEETSPAATEALVQVLRTKYRLDFKAAHSEPSANSNKQTTSVIWNATTVDGERRKWPDEIEQWLQVRSEDFGELVLEAVEGKVFDRYPGLFHFAARNREAGQESFEFNLVPLHLKAMAEGSKRRKMAARILAAAVKAMSKDPGASAADWVIGGDYNAELATGDFDAMLQGSLVPLSAGDENGGAMSYLKSPRSLIDHIFLSANLAQKHGEDSYFVVAAEKGIPDYVARISDHRPVLVRLSLKDAFESASPQSARTPEAIPLSLRSALGEVPFVAGESGRGTLAIRATTPVSRGSQEAETDIFLSRDLELEAVEFEVSRAIGAYIPLLKASYDLAHGVPNPPVPQSYKVLGEVRARGRLEALEAAVDLTPLARAAVENDFRALAQEEIRPVRPGQLEAIEEPTAFGFVVREERSGAIIVCIRGTQTPDEWAKNFTAIPSNFNEVPDFGLVHLGFEQMWRRVRASVMDVLNPLPTATRITFLGHSLGGAMATLGAVDAARNLGRRDVDLCTFGGPRVGMVRFRKNFNRLITRCFRVTNQADIVPHIPPVLMGFNHVGLEIGVKGAGANPHSLDAYLAGLRSIGRVQESLSMPGIDVESTIAPRIAAGRSF